MTATLHALPVIPWQDAPEGALLWAEVEQTCAQRGLPSCLAAALAALKATRR